MVFSSLLFLICFLPLCLGIYFLIKRIFNKNSAVELRAKNAVLLLFSIAFYAFGGVKYLLLLLGVIMLNWIGGFMCASERHKGLTRKVSLVIVVVLNLGLLFVFKYFNLLVGIVENMFFSEAEQFSLANVFLAKGNGALGIKEIVLPIGISFYMFQALSYVVDVYRGVVSLQGNLCKFALYISFFPQLIAGPIVQYKDVESQINSRTENTSLFAEGIIRFCYGLGKKVLLANTFGETVDMIWELDVSQIGAAVGWFGAIAYSLQIYYDFSGYSDMAIGLGKMFGFNFKENFNLPYTAGSIQEFWRRWHISLSSWFRDYVYIPLGGNRCARAKLYRNIFIVFVLTGIWHGANQTFLIWGVAYAILLIAERAFVGEWLRKNPLKFVNRLFTFVTVTLLWVVFRAEDIFGAFSFIGSMFKKGTEDYSIMSFLSAKVILAFVAGIVLSGLFSAKKENETCVKVSATNCVFAFLLLVASMFLLVNGTYNPFIYFQF